MAYDTTRSSLPLSGDMVPSQIGLGLNTQQVYPPEHALSTAPASPIEDVPSHALPQDKITTSTSYQLPPPGATVGVFEFQDAIQETVVTTTTRTRISLQPLITQPAVDLQERDPREYVLAHVPTPEWLRKFQIEQDGRTVTFQEADQPLATVHVYQDRQRKIAENGGTTKTTARLDNHDAPTRGIEQRSHHMRKSSVLKRTATPLSAEEAVELGSLERRIKKPRSQLELADSTLPEQPSLNRRAISGAFRVPSNASPMTPGPAAADTVPALQPRGNGNPKNGLGKTALHRLRQSELPADDLSDRESDVQMEDRDSLEGESQLGPPFYGMQRRKQREAEESAVAGASRSGGTATPPELDGDLDDVTEPVLYNPRRLGRQRPLLQNILTSSQQDASLPSPSLSPITAAANAASRNRNLFEQSFASHIEGSGGAIPGLDLDDNSNAQHARLPNASHRPAVPQFPFASGVQQAQPSAPTHGLSLKDIPRIVEFFDGMPEQLQKYVMYQLLRRCAKPTMRMVAGVINPALKCDPFNHLPPEIGLNITRFLDAQSMCQAAQVSKKWRRLINSDETAWKDLLDRDDFVLPRDEIRTAVEQGWGWQYPGDGGAEQDLRVYLRKAQPTAMDASMAYSEDDETASSTMTVRNKKRIASKQGSGRKNKHRRAGQPSSSATKPVAELWRKMYRSAQGPRGYAEAANEAIPNPETIPVARGQLLASPAIGLPSLKNMHLFKTLYQRHHLIRQAWMKEDSKPQHLAFRAHHRHVVTCLLFDSDKILTGSDDTKICVYDTKTGALKTRLEGHEGGVWALQYVGDTLVSGSTDRSVRVWDIRTGRQLQKFEGHTSTVRCLVILQPVVIGKDADGNEIKMPTEPLVITGSRDSTLRVWKLPKPGEPRWVPSAGQSSERDNPYFLRCLSGHHNSVRAIAAHGDTLVSGSYDTTVRVWRISTGDLVHRLQGHTQKVYSVVLDHTRNRCISGSMDNLVKVWDILTGACLFNLEGHTSLVGLLDLSSDRLVSAAADSTLRIWDPETGSCKATLSAHTGAITCFQHDGQKVISGSDRTLKMWNVRNGECVRDLLTELSGVWQVRFDERRCVAAVQRNNYTYIEVLDFGASRDGVPADQRGRRIFVDCRGHETVEVEANQPADADAAAGAA
ncbi:SCF ubiquitin ligase complex subunit cdc4 [Friedmanniomyces endolithicus]|nr:SCF ubiquitin ligase complex subunit cdc4 [Friedmanniomyces endolithicus]